MHEYAWWYLYIQVLNAENEKKKEMHRLVESLLPWLNLDLWREVQKQKDSGRENVDFENQLKAMLEGTWDADPDVPQVPRVDDITSSATQGKADSAAQMFDQGPRSIKDTLFPGQGPTVQGGPGDIPPEYREFYEDLPDVKDFPPEEPKKEE